MIGWWLLLVGQVATVTVGDTVWIARRVAVPSGQILRPQAWDLGDLGLALGAPEVDYRADSATVRYPIVLWFPGSHRLVVPGPIIVSPAGSLDTLSSSEVVIEVASVLPSGRPKAELPPQGAAPLLAQSTRSLVPVGVLLGLVGVTAAAFRGWQARRRRIREIVAPLPAAPEPPLVEILDRWSAAGETRTALDGWAKLIEREVGGGGDPARRDEARELLERMAVAGFRPDSSVADAQALIDRARSWMARS